MRRDGRTCVSAHWETGKSHLAQAIGRAVIQQGYRVVYREAHSLIEEIADATLDGTRKTYLAELAAIPLLIIDDLGMRKLPHTAAEDLLEVVMRRYERASTLLTSNRPVDDWGKLLGDTAAVTALLDRLLHHAHVLKCGPRSWRTKVQTDLRTEAATKKNSTGLDRNAGNGRFCGVEKWPVFRRPPRGTRNAKCRISQVVIRVEFCNAGDGLEAVFQGGCRDEHRRAEEPVQVTA